MKKLKLQKIFDKIDRKLDRYYERHKIFEHIGWNNDEKANTYETNLFDIHRNKLTLKLELIKEKKENGNK